MAGISKTSAFTRWSVAAAAVSSVVDAGEDPDAYFQDLGGAVRKIRIDFDVRSSSNPQVAIGSRQNPLHPFCISPTPTSIIRISPSPGNLLYLKPSYSLEVAIDVRAYGNIHDAFPHETT